MCASRLELRLDRPTGGLRTPGAFHVNLLTFHTHYSSKYALPGAESWNWHRILILGLTVESLDYENRLSFFNGSINSVGSDKLRYGFDNLVLLRFRQPRKHGKR
jgi:hypothetical protein